MLSPSAFFISRSLPPFNHALTHFLLPCSPLHSLPQPPPHFEILCQRWWREVSWRQRTATIGGRPNTSSDTSSHRRERSGRQRGCEGGKKGVRKEGGRGEYNYLNSAIYIYTVCTKKNLPLPFNNISLSVRGPYIFSVRFNLFLCYAICFSAWQFMILIKECACMHFLTGRMVFSDYTKTRILFYHAKGSHARSHHMHARSHHEHAQSHTSLLLRFAYFFAHVPSDSLVVQLYRSWLQHWITLNFSITHEQA